MAARRATILDVADRAGVSIGAVSIALNGRPGVSDQTRERVRAIAAELGYRASASAQSLRRRRAGDIGLVLARPALMLGVQPFFVTFIAGLQDALADRHQGLQLQSTHDVQEEIAVYRRWHEQGRVDGVVIVDWSPPDPRRDALPEIGLPAVYMASRRDQVAGPVVELRHGPGMDAVVDHLYALGHRSIARIGGKRGLANTERRTRRFRERVRANAGMSLQSTSTDFSAEESAAATRRMLSSAARPTAILYENAVMAIAGLTTASAMGYAVPRDLSIVCLDDSALCTATTPAMSAVSSDVVGAARIAARALLQLIDGAEVADEVLPASTLIVRESTGPAPRIP